ncbi:MAG: hypothetical protein ABSF46_12080 [Terriglobia bacterium]
MNPSGSFRYSYGLVAGFLLSVGLLGHAESGYGRTKPDPETRSGLSINVRVHNYAPLSNETLTQAEIEAAEILGKAGIEITWTNCDTTRKDLGGAAECIQLPGPTTLFVRILPCFGVIPGTDKQTMGFALGNLASVSIRRVSEEAAEFEVKPYEVLGPAIAHELGHLLLRRRGHSPSGIMRARWRREDYERAPLGAFKFTAEQARSIRAEVAMRVREQAAGEVVAKTAPE